MSILQGLNGYYQTCGVRGVLAISTYRLVGLPKEIRIQPEGVKHAVHLRVRTTDVSVYHEILLRGEYAIDLPSPPKTIVDVGANIGMASLFFAHRYPQARIIAVEAEPSNFTMLTKNVAGYPNIVPIHAALWNKDGEISVSDPDPADGAFGKWGFFTHEGDGVRVRAVTMPTLMKEKGIESIDLLKVDIEGAEKEVFSECDWMDRVDCLAIELHDRWKPGCTAAVSAVTAGFRKFEKGETSFYVRSGRNAG